MRLIDKDKLLQRVYEHPYERNGMTDAEWCRKCIYESPTIEAEPVRHGRWIECDYKHLEHGFIETEPKAGLCCSNCRTGFQKRKMIYKQYCPYCGSKNEGD